MAAKAQTPIRLQVVNFITQWGTVLTILVLVLFFAVWMPPFISPSNLLTILRSISIVTVIAIGITLSLTVNGFDLSVGSVATLADALVISAFVWYEFGVFPAILIALGGCLAVGLLNSFLIVKLRIPDLLATLSMLFIVEGVATTYTGGGSISEGMPRLDGTETFGKLDPVFKAIGSAPWIILIMLVVVLLVHLFLNQTKHGRYLYVVGGNLEAARLSGIPVERYRTLAYVLSALLAALGGGDPGVPHRLFADQCGGGLSDAGGGSGLHWLQRWGGWASERARDVVGGCVDGGAGKRTGDDVGAVLLVEHRQRGGAGRRPGLHLFSQKMIAHTF